MEKLIKLFEELFSKIDPDSSILPQSYKDQVIKSIQENIESYTDVKIAEKIAEVTKTLNEGFEAKENEAAEQIELATSKLTEAVEKAKQTAITELDEQYATQLEESLGSIIKKFEIVKSKYSANIENLEEALSIYIESYIEANQPEETVINIAKLEKLTSMFESMKNMLFKDGELEVLVKESTTTKDAEYDKLIESNLRLNGKLKLLEGEKHLNEKIKDLKPKVSEFIIEKLGGKSIEDIDAKFVSLVEEFDKKEQTEILEARKSARKINIKTDLEVNKETKLNESELGGNPADYYKGFFKHK